MDFDHELLRQKHMEAARELLCAKYTWFQHITAVDHIPSIRRSGIEPRRDRPPLPHIVNVWGDAFAAVSCFYPVGCSECESRGTQLGPFAKLAIESSQLPYRITTDWTYGYTNTSKFRDMHPSLSLPDIIVRAIEDRGSVLFYEPVAAKYLRVCAKTSNDDRTTWPRLEDIEDAQIEQFDDGLRPIR
jgi:hypothetical protein